VKGDHAGFADESEKTKFQLKQCNIFLDRYLFSWQNKELRSMPQASIGL
jgi:hypothetical protein